MPGLSREVAKIGSYYMVVAIMGGLGQNKISLMNMMVKTEGSQFHSGSLWFFLLGTILIH